MIVGADIICFSSARELSIRAIEATCRNVSDSTHARAPHKVRRGAYLSSANGTEYDLVRCVFTDTLARVQRLIDMLNPGVMSSNTGVIPNEAAPIGSLCGPIWDGRAPRRDLSPQCCGPE